MALGEIGGVCRDFIGDDAGLHVVAVRQAQMLLRRDIAKHGAAEPADHRGADAGRDVIVTRCDIGGQWPKRIERRFVAYFQLLVHVDFDLVHRHMAGAFDHHLTAFLPCNFRQFAKRFQLGELRAVVGIRNRTGTQAVAERERDIVFAHQIRKFPRSAYRGSFPYDARDTISP